MKDFISKVTFGFFMAQLLPGAIVVFAINFVVKAVPNETTISLTTLLTNIGEGWFESPLGAVAFIFMAVAIGMIIHGLNWTVLAWLENKNSLSKPEPVRKSFWHTIPLIFQVFISPLKMVIEILSLMTAPNIDSLILDENIPNIKEKHMPQFLFLQEFYLHFGQFYAHTAYSFLATVVCSIIWCIDKFTWSSLGITIGLYFLTSVFFLLGRIKTLPIIKTNISFV